MLVVTLSFAGSEIMGQLLLNPKWSQVTTIGRREATVPKAYEQYPSGKLTQKIVDMDKLETEASEAIKGADTVFCALGTTRRAAGSAEAFKRVDLDYVEAAAKLARAAGVPHFSLVSSMGANAHAWAPSWAVLHGLYYTKIKGLVRETLSCGWVVLLWF